MTKNTDKSASCQTRWEQYRKIWPGYYYSSQVFTKKPSVPISGDEMISRISQAGRKKDKRIKTLPPPKKILQDMQHGRRLLETNTPAEVINCIIFSIGFEQSLPCFGLYSHKPEQAIAIPLPDERD